MSTTSDSKPSPPSADFSQLSNGGDDHGTTPKDEALAALESDLQQEKDSRMEERFLWVVAVAILVDVIWFRDSPNPTFPIVVLVLELIALTILARRWGVEEVSSLVERIIHSV